MQHSYLAVLLIAMHYMPEITPNPWTNYRHAGEYQQLNTQALATFGASRVNYTTSTLSAHTCAKTMCALSA